MNLKALFVDSFDYSSIVRNLTGKDHSYPLALGIMVHIVELQGGEAWILQTKDFDEVKKKSEELDIGLVGFTTVSSSICTSLEQAKQVKQANPNIKTVFGGYHASAAPKELLSHPQVDFVIIGEGEKPFLELISAIKGNQRLEQIKGLAFREKGNNIVNPASEFLNLEQDYITPLVNPKTKHLLSIFGPPLSSETRFGMPITYSRGCVHACNYCASSKLMGRTVRYRKAEAVVQEMLSLHQQMGIKMFQFTDFTFNDNSEKVLELCNAIKEINLEERVSWYCTCRPVPNFKIYREMREAGCKGIVFGVESFLQSVLDSLNRTSKTTEVEESLAQADELGIITRAFLVLGAPGEEAVDYSSYVQSYNYFLVNLARKGLDWLRIGFLTPFPGTKIYERCLSENLIEEADLRKYDTNRPILKHHLSKEELLSARLEIVRSFYNSFDYQKHLEDKIRRFPLQAEALRRFYDEAIKT